MTSSNGDIFRVIGHLCGNSPVSGEFPAQRPVTRSFDFLPEASFGLRVLSLPASVCLCVRPSVCVCGKHLLVRAITHHPFKLGSPNLDNRCKRPWLRSLLFWGGDWPWPSRSNWTPKSKFTPFWACACHNSPPIEVIISKFGTKCILALFRSLPILGLIEIDLQLNF